MSCNSCHNVMAGGDDNLPNSVGVKGQHGGRSAPTVWNSTFMSVQKAQSPKVKSVAMIRFIRVTIFNG